MASARIARRPPSLAPATVLAVSSLAGCLLFTPLDELSEELGACSDGAQSHGESDVDCGGACAKCADGRRCAVDGDCASGSCAAGICRPPCGDGLQNGGESDVDCGGELCTACADGRRCADPHDCASGVCAAGFCAAPACDDGVKNGAESDVDCGGPACPKCGNGKVCAAPLDCLGGACVKGVCAGCIPGMIAVGISCIDATEVTASAYQEFLLAHPTPGPQPPFCAFNTSFHPATQDNGCSVTSFDPLGKPNHPVVCVDWCDARAYCAFRGKRLCGRIGGGAGEPGDHDDATRNEWYNACSRGAERTYPYGNVYNATMCNGAAYGAGTPVPTASTPCVGGHDGLYDMSGNVWEWEDSCEATAGEADGCRHRGGSFLSAEPAHLACGFPTSSNRSYRGAAHGFRCCGG